MTPEEATIAVFDALAALEIPFMVVGSLSSNVYGIPRSTKDADVVVELGDDRSPRSRGISGRDSSSIRRCPSRPSLGRSAANWRSWASRSRSRYSRSAAIRTTGRGSPARVPTEVFGHTVPVPTAEDVIVTKLRWARSKDRDDVRDVIAVQGDAVDWDYVYTWADRHGTRGLLDEIRRSIPPI